MGFPLRYIYDNEDILLELDGSNNIVTRYTHGPGIDEPLVMEKGSQSFFYHADGLGSITEITDSLGVVKQRYSYSSFGKIESQLDPNFIQPYTFTAREFDPETGLYFYRTRYYNADTARFLQEDPIGFAGGDLNLYTYVLNQPINWVDPWGLAGDCPDVPTAPPGVDIDRNIQEAERRWNPFWFRKQVRNKGPWDYKQRGPQYEDFGNFNYGATGTAFEFSERTLLREAGRAQVEASTSKPEWGDPGSRLNPWGGNPPYGDDPRDQVQIKKGIEYYKCKRKSKESDTLSGGSKNRLRVEGECGA